MNSTFTKRLLAAFAATTVGVTMTACGGGSDDSAGGSDFDGEIKVGILHSLSGTTVSYTHLTLPTNREV